LPKSSHNPLACTIVALPIARWAEDGAIRALSQRNRNKYVRSRPDRPVKEAKRVKLE
jgi:hypothetical protein